MQRIDPKYKKYIIISLAVAAVLLVLSIASIMGQRKTSDSTPSRGTANSSSRSSTSAVNNSITYGNYDNSQVGTSTDSDNATSSSTSYSGTDNVISGLSSSTSNLPNSEISRINSELKVMLKNNNITSAPSDAIVRNGTFLQTLADSQKLIYTSTFIVDIPSLQKSYAVEDRYSPLPEKDSGLTDYTVVITCPAVNQRIYSSDVNCVNYLPGV